MRIKITEELRQELRKIIKEEIHEALSAEITWEKRIDEVTGKPLAATEYKKEKIFLPAFWVQHLKFHEGAYRGMQETTDHMKNTISEVVMSMNNNSAIIETMKNIMLSFENRIKQLSQFTLLIEKSGILEGNIKQVEYTGEVIEGHP